MGRLLHDRVTTLATGVDGAVRRISTEYDHAGNVKTLTSYNNASTSSGTIVNQLCYEYDVNGQLQKEYSATSGAVNVSATPCIQYTYDTTKSGGMFTKSLRPTSVTYPGGRVIGYEYGTSGSPDDLFSRYTGVKDGNTTLVTYVDNGVSTPVRITYNEPGLTLDYTTTGALDRFGRITDHAWKKGATDIARIKHAYDRIGNRLYRQDLAATAASKSFDELYAYDGMNQLVDMQRGTLNTTKTAVTNKGFGENFAFDATGNWQTFKQDTDGNGTWDLNQTRTHNKANEIATTGGTSAYVASDRNGNMTKLPKPDAWNAAFTCVYDAWNRMVQVKDGATTVATYSYNALSHRVKKVTTSETRYFYFNRSWQCLEERTGTSTTADTTYVWGLRYIDDLVCRDNGTERLYSLADPNWNVVTLCNTSGVIQERIVYNAFGKANWCDASFATKTASSYSWNRSFTGQVFDNETGLMLYRNRFYHAGLGRFVTRDPIEYGGNDMSLFRYVFNSPSCLNDIMGMQTVYGPNHGHTCFADGSVRNTAGMDARILREMLNPPRGGRDLLDGAGSHTGGSSYRPMSPIHSVAPVASNVKKCCRTTRICIAVDAALEAIDIRHCWLVTSTKSGGMGPEGGGGLPMSPCCGTQTEILDHSDESGDCVTVPNIDETCVNKALILGRPTGAWSPTNNCNTLVDVILYVCYRGPRENGPVFSR